VCPSTGNAVKSCILEPALKFTTSSILQEGAVESLRGLYEQIVITSAVDFVELYTMLHDRLSSAASKNAVYNLSKCIATVIAATTAINRHKVVSDTISVLSGPMNPADVVSVRRIQLSMLVTGDVGRLVDLSTLDGVTVKLQADYLKFFESNSEDLRNAAAYALGNATIGSQASFLPLIVGNLESGENKKQQYLLLSALREFILKGTAMTVQTYNILPLLENHCFDEEEGVRTMVAECFGALACLHPTATLPRLVDLQQRHSLIKAPGGYIADEDTGSKNNALACWTVATSIKLAIAGKVDATQLSNYMSSFLELLEQEELSVRNAALLMVYSVTHHMPLVVMDKLNDLIVPTLFKISQLKLERKVDLGPFTHTVDDALSLRKTSLSIFATCLDSLPGSMDVTSVLSVLVKALGDTDDIQLQAHQITISMCQRFPSYIAAAIETFVEPLEKSLNKKAGHKTSTGTELDRLNDWIKSALRVMLALGKVEGVGSNQKFSDFVARTKSSSKFSQMLMSINS
jgi:cullin-associated NEDD8-dissociated protein 1